MSLLSSARLLRYGSSVCRECRLTLLRSSSTSSRYTPPVKITTDEELDKIFSEPTWTVQSLLSQSNPEELHSDINPSSLRQLLRRSGLQFPKDEQEERKLLFDLQRQLVFVDHVQDIDTSGIEPLNRIGEDGEKLQWEDLQTEDNESEILSVKHFSEKLDRGYYVVRDNSGIRE
ncbi:hypothetical protein BZA70DRAFT_275238 [Myxozyma melibiosi]|uniref:Glutamyl-tRNA amidotransferase complex subunit Gta3 domain-containing protein n=1 Tax=Myxozyma melibiosi TaxID=54550 RepID=A0ABR1FAI9_9ASCO